MATAALRFSEGKTARNLCLRVGRKGGRCRGCSRFLHGGHACAQQGGRQCNSRSIEYHSEPFRQRAAIHGIAYPTFLPSWRRDVSTGRIHLCIRGRASSNAGMLRPSRIPARLCPTSSPLGPARGALRTFPPIHPLPPPGHLPPVRPATCQRPSRTAQR